MRSAGAQGVSNSQAACTAPKPAMFTGSDATIRITGM